LIFDIVQAGDPVLRQPAQRIDPSHLGTSEFNELIESMVETMHAAPGVGLAAPQVGLPIQLVVLEDRPETIENLDPEARRLKARDVVPLTVLVNPTLEPVGDETVTFYEGCLSVSGWAAMTPRWLRVRVRALNQMGDDVVLEWEGWPARIAQHEMDHLAGTLYIDRMDSRTFASAEYLAEVDDDEDEEDAEEDAEEL